MCTFYSVVSSSCVSTVAHPGWFSGCSWEALFGFMVLFGSGIHIWHSLHFVCLWISASSPGLSWYALGPQAMPCEGLMEWHLSTRPFHCWRKSRCRSTTPSWQATICFSFFRPTFFFPKPSVHFAGFISWSDLGLQVSIVAYFGSSCCLLWVYPSGLITNIIGTSVLLLSLVVLLRFLLSLEHQAERQGFHW